MVTPRVCTRHRRAPFTSQPTESIDVVKRALLDLGLLVGRPIHAREVVKRIDVRSGPSARLNEGPPVTVFVDTGTFTTVWSLGLGDHITQAGGRNVAGAATGQRPPGAAARLKPGYYLATPSSGTTLHRRRQDREMARLDAVRAGQFGIVAAVLEPGPSVGRGV